MNDATPTALLHRHYRDWCVLRGEGFIHGVGAFSTFLNKSRYAYKSTPVRPEDLKRYEQTGDRATGYRMPPMIGQPDRYTAHVHFPDYAGQAWAQIEA